MSLIAVGKIVNVHGIHGVMKVKPYLIHAQNFGAFNPLTDKDGKKNFEANLVGHQGDCWLVAIKGITDRNTAENFKGLELYTQRTKLPPITNDEYYQCDLVGLTVLVNNQEFGKIVHILNYGAGDIIQIKTQKQTLEFSFSKQTFPKVDIANHYIHLVIPEDMKGIIK